MNVSRYTVLLALSVHAGLAASQSSIPMLGIGGVEGSDSFQERLLAADEMFSVEALDDLSFDTIEEERAGPLESLLEPLRVSLTHELSYKFEAPTHLVNNRSSVRLEYSKLLSPKWFVRLDTKLNLFWTKDHRAEAEDAGFEWESVTREAYLQHSFGDTSIRAGLQVLVWGISEGGAITDVISPRNESEFFFVPLEESRIAQPMLVLDQFSDIGDWSFFLVPAPAYNEYPQRGTEYYIPEFFDGTSEPDSSWESDGFEYGMRWKRTFGKSDFSLMAASVIDNDYLIEKYRYSMFGLTANIAQGNLLWRIEAGYKTAKEFFAQAGVDEPLEIVESDQLDFSLGFDYSPGGRALVFSSEFVRSQLIDGDSTILGRERNMDSLVFAVSNKFFNDDLTLSWMTIYSRPYSSFLHSLRSSYRIDDNSMVFLDVFLPNIRDKRSGSWDYRDQKQISFKYQYQF